jgi:hypothetical protein
MEKNSSSSSSDSDGSSAPPRTLRTLVDRGRRLGPGSWSAHVTTIAEVVPWLAASLLGLGTRAVGLMWLPGPWLTARMMLLGARAAE